MTVCMLFRALPLSLALTNSLRAAPVLYDAPCGCVPSCCRDVGYVHDCIIGTDAGIGSVMQRLRDALVWFLDVKFEALSTSMDPALVLKLVQRSALIISTGFMVRMH
jgi:hypothetical protein